MSGFSGGLAQVIYDSFPDLCLYTLFVNPQDSDHYATANYAVLVVLGHLDETPAYEAIGWT